MKPRTAATIASRAFEGLVGASLGGAAGGAAGALAYEPQRPQEWMDMYGNIYSRPLTREEKNTRLQIAAAAALAGALGGAGVSLGGSKLLRARVASVEREAAQDVANNYLNPLRELIEDWKGTRNSFIASSPGAAQSETARKLSERVEAARTLLRKQEHQVKKLVDEADSRRSALPFVGGLTDQSKGITGYDWTSMSHAGVAKQHFDLFAKEQGYPKMNLDNVYRVFSDAVEKAMTKTSAAAFFAELEKIAAVGAPLWRGSAGLRRAQAVRPWRAPSARAPQAASLTPEGTLAPAEGSTTFKTRNAVQPVQPLEPVKVSTPPTPDPTPGGA